jgi:hypothetical protein
MPVEVTSKYEYKFGKVTKEFIRLNATAEWQTTTLPDLKAADFDIKRINSTSERRDQVINFVLLLHYPN